MKTLKFLSFVFLAGLTLVGCQKSQIEEEVINQELTSNKHIDYYTVDFGELNNSGVMGTALLALEGNELTVTIDASGLEPNQLHPQHIHGFVDSNANASCPPMSADDDGDGLVELGEGLPFYGPVLLPLTPFPTADANGEIHYMETFTLTAEEADQLKPMQNNAIVLHGMTVNGNYVATLPVACGQVSKSQSQGKGNK